MKQEAGELVVLGISCLVAVVVVVLVSTVGVEGIVAGLRVVAAWSPVVLAAGSVTIGCTMLVRLFKQLAADDDDLEARQESLTGDQVKS